MVRPVRPPHRLVSAGREPVRPLFARLLQQHKGHGMVFVTYWLIFNSYVVSESLLHTGIGDELEIR